MKTKGKIKKIKTQISVSIYGLPTSSAAVTTLISIWKGRFRPHVPCLKLLLFHTTQPLKVCTKYSATPCINDYALPLNRNRTQIYRSCHVLILRSTNNWQTKVTCRGIESWRTLYAKWQCCKYEYDDMRRQANCTDVTQTHTSSVDTNH